MGRYGDKRHNERAELSRCAFAIGNSSETEGGSDAFLSCGRFLDVDSPRPERHGEFIAYPARAVRVDGVQCCAVDPAFAVGADSRFKVDRAATYNDFAHAWNVGVQRHLAFAGDVDVAAAGDDVTDVTYRGARAAGFSIDRDSGRRRAGS